MTAEAARATIRCRADGEQEKRPVEPCLLTLGGAGAGPLQRPFDAAVVMPTILRPSVVDALRSVLAQRDVERVQILLGLDRPGDLAPVRALEPELPSGWLLQALWPGYSTSVRHGGLSPARDGGVLRCVLSHLAHSPHVAYLDDDNWWQAEHLRALLDAVRDADWAYSYRWFVHPDTRRPVCVDQWESVGVGRGIFRERFGGFVDPNCLMIDKRRCAAALARWNEPLEGDPKAMSADRNVFNELLSLLGAPSGRPTTFYVLDPTDGMHPFRLERMGPAWDQAGRAES
ncbi:glycosyltransferase family 2 protein [Rhizosaccharibacter radicis]|uniref:Glycosyltransferase family 2 protein n=1 Tax=Rhizosaccharibacter radicis TaxID=2782605 RepID=A0ABT1VYE9_9PROT|nr:glycosyltransferase family 2 protein [Acetobacteraceae bacterium KSS12]